MKTLRPFQVTVIDGLRSGLIQGHKRQLLALATGAGKTVVASHLIHRAADKGHKSLFIVDRIELVDQAIKKISSSLGFATGGTVGAVAAKVVMRGFQGGGNP